MNSGCVLHVKAVLCAMGVALGTVSPAWAAADRSSLKMQEAAAALLQGRFDKAVTAYDEALKEGTLVPARQAAVYTDRGVAKWRLRQLDEAQADFTKAISLNADYAAAYNNRGILLLERGDAEGAVRDFDKAIALSPQFGPALSNRGNAHLRLNRAGNAEADFRKAMDLLPSHPVPFNGRALVAQNGNRPFLAVRYLNRAVGLNAQYTPAYVNRATALLALQKNDDAIQDLDRLIGLNANDVSLYVKRGEAHAREKRLVFAFRDYGKALELDPQNLDALIGRAGQNLERRRPDLALEDVKQALALDPNRARAYFVRGQARLQSNDAAGMEDLDKAIELSPEMTEAYRARSVAREKAGQKEAALSDARKALELDPVAKENRDLYRTVAGQPAETVLKPLSSNAGWDIYALAGGRFVAVSDKFPKLQVPLEMAAAGTPTIIEWTPLKDALAGLGLMRFQAGEKAGAAFEYVAIVDLFRNQVISEEPYVVGSQKAVWTWTGTSVSITDPEGLTSVYELRKPRPVETVRRRDDDFDLFGGRRGGGGGLFGWLFR